MFYVREINSATVMMVSLVKCSITVLILVNTWCTSAAKFCLMSSSTFDCDAGQICCNYQCVYGSSCLGSSCDIDSDCSSFESCCSGKCWDEYDCKGHSCYSSGDCSTYQDCCSGICGGACSTDADLYIAIGSISGSIFLIGLIVAVIMIRRRRPVAGGHVVRNGPPQRVATESAATINYRQPPTYPPLQAGQPYQPGHPQYGYGAVTNFAAPPPYQTVASGQATGGGGNNDKTNLSRTSAPATK